MLVCVDFFHTKSATLKIQRKRVTYNITNISNDIKGFEKLFQDIKRIKYKDLLTSISKNSFILQK